MLNTWLIVNLKLDRRGKMIHCFRSAMSSKQRGQPGNQLQKSELAYTCVLYLRNNYLRWIYNYHYTFKKAEIMNNEGRPYVQPHTHTYTKLFFLQKSQTISYLWLCSKSLSLSKYQSQSPKSYIGLGDFNSTDGMDWFGNRLALIKRKQW